MFRPSKHDRMFGIKQEDGRVKVGANSCWWSEERDNKERRKEEDLEDEMRGILVIYFFNYKMGFGV